MNTIYKNITIILKIKKIIDLEKEEDFEKLAIESKTPVIIDFYAEYLNLLKKLLLI